MQAQVRKIIFLALAISFGILATAMFFMSAYLAQERNKIFEKIKEYQAEAKHAKPAVMGVVLVASKDIPLQIPITPSDLSIKEMPVEYIHPRAVTSLDEAIGQISSVPISAGEQLLKNKLMPPGTTSKNSAEITPEEKKAANVLADDNSGVVNLIQPQVLPSKDAKTEQVNPPGGNALPEYLSADKGPNSEDEHPVVEIYRGANKEVVPLSEKK